MRGALLLCGLDAKAGLYLVIPAWFYSIGRAGLETGVNVQSVMDTDWVM